jgi:hypothetical protein
MSSEQLTMRTISLRGGEILVALLLIVMSILAWIETNSFEPETGMVRTLGPAIFPRILLIGISLGSIGIIIQALRSKSTDTVSFGPWHKIPIAFCMMLFQALTFEELSVFLSAGLTLPALLWLAGVKPKMILIVTTCFLLFVYVFFILILRVHFPMQFLPTILG